MCSPRKSNENFSILTFLGIKTNISYTRLEVIAKQCSALQAEFITGVKLICYFVLNYCFLHWAHPSNMSIGDLDTLYLCLNHSSETGVDHQNPLELILWATILAWIVDTCCKWTCRQARLYPALSTTCTLIAAVCWSVTTVNMMEPQLEQF